MRSHRRRKLLRALSSEWQPGYELRRSSGLGVADFYQELRELVTTRMVEERWVRTGTGNRVKEYRFTPLD